MQTNFSTMANSSVALSLETSAPAYHPYLPNAQAARQSRSAIDLSSSAHNSHHSGTAPRESFGQQTSSAVQSPLLSHTSEAISGMRDLHLNGEPRIFPGVVSRPRRGSLISKDGSKQSSGHEIDGEAKRRSALFPGVRDGGFMEEESDADEEDAGGG